MMTYKAVGRLIINYAAPAWSPNLHDAIYRKIQYIYIYTEAEHSELLSAQYLARCMEPENVCHPITTRGTPKRQMNETLNTIHRNTVELLRIANDRKATLIAFHTDAVKNNIKSHESIVVLGSSAPPIGNSEKDLTRKERSTLTQLRSGYCGLLGPNKSRFKKTGNLKVCADCGKTPHDVKHLFAFLVHPTPMTLSDLWSRLADPIRELGYLEVRDQHRNEHGLKGELQQRNLRPEQFEQFFLVHYFFCVQNFRA